jgi:SAM-dependent methyltransferase
LRGASPRKRAQIAAFVRALTAAREPRRIVDVGAGHGHLTRALARALEVPALGIERDETLTARARDLAPDGARFVVADAQRELRFQPGDLAVGLHACGSLGDALVVAAARDGADVLLVSCCAQKIEADARPPLSKLGASLGVTMRRDVLGLANLTSRPTGVETSMRTIVQSRETRFALSLLLRGRGCALQPGEEARGINRRQLTRGLGHAAARALSHRGLPPASRAELEEVAERARTEYGLIRRLSLPRAMLGRPIELAVALDRAQHLCEAGHAARVGPLFSIQDSPRNLAVMGSRLHDGA